MAQLFLLYFTLISFSLAENCDKPSVLNGEVSGSQGDNSFSGRVKCDGGYHLVGGSSFLKCRNGQWSGKIPVCSVVGACQELPFDLLKNGRVTPIRRSRKSAYRFQCRKGFTLLGERRTYCKGDAWSHTELPVCAKPGCDESVLETVEPGIARPLIRGAAYKFKCEEGVELKGSPMVFCDGRKWNDSMPTCHTHPETPLLEAVKASGEPLKDWTVRLGEEVTFICNEQGGTPLPQVRIEINNPGYDNYMTDSLPGSNSMDLAVHHQGLEVKCSAQNSVGTAETTRKLRVIAVPRDVKIIGPIYPDFIQSGQPVTFFCESQGGIPEPQLQWSIQTEEIFTVLDGQSDNSLTFYPEDLDLDSSEEFTLSCEASNEAGDLKTSENIVIGSEPKSVTVTGPTAMYQDESFEFICEVTGGYPEPEIVWDIKAFSVEDIPIESVSGEKVLLHISEHTKGEVNVSCQAANQVGAKMNQITSLINYLPNGLSVSVPEEAHPGDVLNLLCKDEDDEEDIELPGRAELTWKLEGFGAELLQAKEERGKATIVIQDSDEENEFGLMVQCVAELPNGNKMASSIHEIVVVPAQKGNKDTDDPETVTLVPEEYYYQYESVEENESNKEVNENAHKSYVEEPDTIAPQHHYYDYDSVYDTTTKGKSDDNVELRETTTEVYENEYSDTTEIFDIPTEDVEISDNTDLEISHAYTEDESQETARSKQSMTTSTMFPTPKMTKENTIKHEQEHGELEESYEKPEEILEITPLKQIEGTRSNMNKDISVKSSLQFSSSARNIKLSFIIFFLPIVLYL